MWFQHVWIGYVDEHSSLKDNTAKCVCVWVEVCMRGWWCVYMCGSGNGDSNQM